jgi:ectoine hydroxylase-related dioxygenase (phytanoyl-CoA dioxygenase family)
VGRYLEGVQALPPELVYYEDRNDTSTLKQVQRLHEHEPYFEAMMDRSRFEQLARILLGEDVVGKNIQYFNKPAGSGRPTPPHQDGYYFMLEPNHAVTMWLALEDVGEDQGCIHYVSGSHKLGMRPHDSSAVLGFSQQVADFGTPNDRSSEVACPCLAGHLIVHHSLTIHWAGGNVSNGKSREALGLIYYGESAREDEEAHAEYQRRLAAELAAQNRI